MPIINYYDTNKFLRYCYTCKEGERVGEVLVYLVIIRRFPQVLVIVTCSKRREGGGEYS